jgi:RNase P/RNase MRP subunit p29
MSAQSETEKYVVELMDRPRTVKSGRSGKQWPGMVGSTHADGVVSRLRNDQTTVHRGNMAPSKLVRAAAKKRQERKRLDRRNKARKINRKTRQRRRNVGASMTYADAERLHALWLSYVGTVLATRELLSVEETVSRADFHGAKLRVERAKCASLVGVGGIVVQEHTNTFRVVTHTDRIVTLPKAGAVFQFHIDNISIRLFGSQLCVAPATRNVRQVNNNSSVFSVAL